jgi:hypothetical protein
MVDQVVSLRVAQILQAVRTSRLPGGKVFDPRTTALIEYEPPSAHTLRNSLTTPPRTHVETPDAVTVRVHTRNNAPSTLVLSDIDYPGWQTQIDGVDAKSMRCNYVLHCVSLEAGSHEVVFRFEPISYRHGCILAAAGALVLTVYAAGFPRHRVFSSWQPVEER